jgi:hypothetical protein
MSINMVDNSQVLLFGRHTPTRIDLGERREISIKLQCWIKG